MIFRRWTPERFRKDGFVKVEAIHLWERHGFPVYAASGFDGAWVPGWGHKLFNGVGIYVQDDKLARLSAAAIRSDDPDAFVESVLAAYALGGWRVALQVAEAQDGAHA